MSEELFKDDSKYLEGKENWLIRVYFYLFNGLNVLNQFRNLGLGIIAVYIALKLTNYWWLVAMTVPSIIILIIVGYYFVHRATKVQEWLGIRFSSHFGMKSFNYQEESYETLVRIEELLKK